MKIKRERERSYLFHLYFNSLLILFFFDVIIIRINLIANRFKKIKKKDYKLIN